MNGANFSHDWEFHGSDEAVKRKIGIPANEGWFILGNGTALVVFDDETEMWWAFIWENRDPRKLIQNILNLPAFEFRSMRL